MERGKNKGGGPERRRIQSSVGISGRAAMIMCAYDETRGKGDKHSVAVGETVDLVKQRNPEMPISQTKVKRVLATWRPKDHQTIYRFKRSSLSEEDIKLNRWMRDQLVTWQGKKGLKLDEPPNYDRAPNVPVFTIVLLKDRIIPTIIARTVSPHCRDELLSTNLWVLSFISIYAGLSAVKTPRTYTPRG